MQPTLPATAHDPGKSLRDNPFIHALVNSAQRETSRTAPPRTIYLGGQYGSVAGRFAIVDAADYEAINAASWYADKKGGSCYAQRNAPRNAPRGDHHQMVLMHRAVLCPQSGEVVQHINGNGLDNRRANLRTIRPRSQAKPTLVKENEAPPAPEVDDFFEQLSDLAEKNVETVIDSMGPTFVLRAMVTHLRSKGWDPDPEIAIEDLSVAEAVSDLLCVLYPTTYAPFIQETP